MVYLNNTTESQRVFIPRTDIQASAYHPSTGGTEQYYAGQNIEITPQNVINVTGLTEAISAATSDFVTSGEVQSQITAATQNFVTSGDVASQITAATSGFVETSAMTAYTPTSGFATINGSAITEGGNIVIQGGGGDLTRLEEIDTLPATPVDGAVYNYNGFLIRYVDGTGDWGEWYGVNAITNYNGSYPSMSAYLYYAVIPDSMDGQMLCQTSRISGNHRYYFLNLQDKTIDIYDNNSKTGSPLYQVQLNASAETYESTDRIYVSWNDHIIQFKTTNGYSQVIESTCCSVSASTGHYEIVKRPDVSNFPFSVDQNAYANQYGSNNCYTVLFDKNGNVVGPGLQFTKTNFYLNTTSSTESRGISVLSKGNNAPDRIFAPSAGADSGALCVSQGVNAAPVFQTIATALGVDFWTGTQAEYDALATSAGGTGYTATRLYFIKDV